MFSIALLILGGIKKYFLLKIFDVAENAWTCNNSSPRGYQLTEHPQGRFVHQKEFSPNYQIIMKKINVLIKKTGQQAEATVLYTQPHCDTETSEMLVVMVNNHVHLAWESADLYEVYDDGLNTGFDPRD